MATTVQQLRCPCCGVTRTYKHFGITEDGEFDPDERPNHLIERVEREFHGGGRIDVTRNALTLDEARALRASLVAATAQLDAEIAEVGDDEVEEDAEDD